MLPFHAFAGFGDAFCVVDVQRDPSASRSCGDALGMGLGASMAATPVNVWFDSGMDDPRHDSRLSMSLLHESP